MQDLDYGNKYVEFNLDGEIVKTNLYALFKSYQANPSIIEYLNNIQKEKIVKLEEMNKFLEEMVVQYDNFEKGIIKDVTKPTFFNSGEQ